LPALGAPANPAADQRAARAADGHADLNGIWEALNGANWDLEDHSAQAGPMWQTGAIGAEPAGQGIVEGGVIPYLPAALEQKKANFTMRRTSDPEAKCYMPGIPPRELHAFSASDRTDGPGHPVRVRIRQRQSLRQHGQTGGGSGR
jgi:hypothetical protein